MTWGTTLDEGNGPFTVGAQKEENVAAETEHEMGESESTHAEEVTEQPATQEARRSTRLHSTCRDRM